MIEPIQVILVLFALFALSRAWLRYKEGKIKVLEFAFWLVLWSSAIIVIAVPSTAGYVSRTFGIGRPADLILYTAVILIFYLMFRVYVTLDGIEHKISAVVTEIAIKKSKKK